jgi:hypothetical protein
VKFGLYPSGLGPNQPPIQGHVRDGIPQKELVKKLGVSKEVVSRMIHALLRLGFIRREKINKRHFKVFVTRRGLHAFRVCARHVWPHIKRALRDYVKPTDLHEHGFRPGDYFWITVEPMNGYQWLFGGPPLPDAPPDLRTGDTLELYDYGHPDS